MYLSNSAEETLFHIFHEYQRRKRSGASHMEARCFQFPIPGDAFLNGLSVQDELTNLHMIEVSDCEESFVFTRTGIDYCMHIEYDEYTFEIAKNAYMQATLAQQRAENAKKDAYFSKILSVISAVGTFGAFIIACIALFR